MRFLPQDKFSSVHLCCLTLLVIAGSVEAFRSFASGPSAKVTSPASLSFNRPLKGSISPGQIETWRTPPLQSSAYYSVQVSLDSPSKLTLPEELVPRKVASPITFNVVKEEIEPPRARVEVTIDSAGNPSLTKKLHAGDPSGYFIIRAAQTRPAEVTLKAPAAEPDSALGFQLEVRPLLVSAAAAFQLVPSTARDPEHAASIKLGKTVFGTSDDIEYLYNTEEGKTGWQWLKFDYTGAKPQLVFFELDLLDRDVPCTLKLFRQENGPQGQRLVDYKTGIDPTEIRHDDQNDELVGFKFITRVLTPGSYLLSVKANDPRWSLRTNEYDVPPYNDPRRAVDVAMRYMVDIGDSFFSNTPRKGAVRTRAENVTDETERCITCHPAHFTMVSTLTAVRNGYTVRNHPEFKFMMDKLYNALAPFYGFPNTSWLRFELAPTNGISRLGKMLLMYEDLVSHRRTVTPSATANYLRLVYDARDRLPRADTVHYSEKFQPTKTRNYEFDGNRPISDFRVASDSWFVLDRLAKRSHNAELASSAAHLKNLLTSTSTNDLEDIVEQTNGMIQTGDAKFKPLIRENIEKIFARQHTDGGWVTAEYMSNEQFFDAAARAPFEKKTDPSLQFMTGEVLYTLKVAGYNMQDPRVEKAIRWLLGTQRNFGGWLDNKGELFLMPHLETKWAVMGLSQVFPRTGPPLAPAPRAARFALDSVMPTLEWLDQLWYDCDAASIPKVLSLLKSPEPLVREAAAAAIGRMGVDAASPEAFRAAVAPLARALDDRNKMVSRAAAWSLRQLGNDGLELEAVKSALDSPDDYSRRGAARVFYQYAYHMMDREDFARALIRHAGDTDMLVRIESLKALWRWWYRTTDFTLRREIERAFFARAAAEREHPLVRLNVAQAIYNILDENTVQFHKNWLRSIALERDREKAEAARIAEVEKPLARELAATLSEGNPTAKITVLTALDYFFLRGGIGNDYDPITFYDREAARSVGRAILPLLDSPDSEISIKALQALAVSREGRDRDLLLAVMKRLDSKDKRTREIAEQELARFPSDYTPQETVARARSSATSQR